MFVSAKVFSSPPSHIGEPRFENLLKVLRREVPDRPTLFEFFMNEPLYRRLTGVPKPEGDVLPWLTEAFRRAGYDYVTHGGSDFGFPAGAKHREQSVSLNEAPVITDRATFEGYSWPEPDDRDYSSLEKIAAYLPDGMKVIVPGPSGVLENAINLVGFDNLCYMISDDPDLAQDVFDAVGSRLVRHYEIAAAFESVGACISNDDWGFKTQPMLSPAQMRRYVFPWHKRIVATIHAAGKPAILHSCGNAELIMDDMVDDIGFDGKHSYEDTIQPVEEAYERYGGRIAILGGIDVGFICRSTPEEVYRRSKAMLERASGRGGYALGTGNSVPEYVPDEGYFAMLHAALEVRGGA